MLKEIKKLYELGERIFEEYLECKNVKDQRAHIYLLTSKERYALQKYMFDNPVNKGISNSGKNISDFIQDENKTF